MRDSQVLALKCLIYWLTSKYVMLRKVNGNVRSLNNATIPGLVETQKIFVEKVKCCRHDSR